MTKYIFFWGIFCLLISPIFAQKIVGYRNATSYCPMGITLGINDSMNHLPRFAPFWNVLQSSYYGWGKGTFALVGTVSSQNLGLITELNDSVKYKNRVYSSGFSGGLRLGFNKGAVFAGGGVDFPILYKSKRFENGVKTEKRRAYFSPETVRVLPSVFAGFDIRFIEVKAQYFPNNFWGKNAPSFVTSPSQIVNVTIGFNRLWLEDWFKKLQKENDAEKDKDNKDGEDKDKPHRYPWDKNKENET